MPDDADFVKLLDFGIARLQATGTPSERLTVVGLMVGTPAYLAPELWFGGVADERSDIYAFGITLHVMLTGVTPFEGWSLQQLRGAHFSAQPLKLELQHTDALSDRLEALILRCLAWNARDRIQTVAELRESLVALHDPTKWTAADADAFWKSVEKARFG
jgi:serine/threonine-protein kinase